MFHRYSPEKTMNWLKKKVFRRAHRTLFNMKVHGWFDFDLFVEVERTVGVLKARNVSVGGGVQSTTYIRVKSESDSHDGTRPPLPFSRGDVPVSPSCEEEDVDVDQ